MPPLTIETALLIYGPLGAVVVGFITGVLIPKWVVDFIKGLLAGSLEREAKMVDAIDRLTDEVRARRPK